MKQYINESKIINIGETPQFIMIKGIDITNPILLILHGGTAQTAQFTKFNQKLENHFTVVYWDQRGEGKSNHKDINPKSLNLERFIKDIHELTTYLKTRFKKEKIYLLAHSMGTLLGMKTIKKYSNDYISYIAISQVADPIKSDNIAHEKLKQLIKKKKDLKKLLSIERINKENILKIDLNKRTKKLLSLSIKYGGMFFDKKLSTLIKIALSPIFTFKHYNFKDKLKALSQHKEKIEFYYQNNLMEDILEIDVPIYFIHGKEDYIINYDLTKEYFEKIKAAKKEFITFDKSAHFPQFEENEKFNNLIIKKLFG